MAPQLITFVCVPLRIYYHDSRAVVSLPSLFWSPRIVFIFCLMSCPFWRGKGPVCAVISGICRVGSWIFGLGSPGFMGVSVLLFGRTPHSCQNTPFPEADDRVNVLGPWPMHSHWQHPSMAIVTSQGAWWLTFPIMPLMRYNLSTPVPRLASKRGLYSQPPWLGCCCLHWAQGGRPA